MYHYWHREDGYSVRAKDEANMRDEKPKEQD
jgi:hypothetical protein